MYKLYGFMLSGNCYKPRLLLSHLGQPFEWIEVDIPKGETRTPGFLAINPAGRTPVLEIEPGVRLAESNAILWYLAEGTRYLPEDRLAQARVLQWLFFEQNSSEPFLAGARFIVRILGKEAENAATLEEQRKRGYAALKVMESHLAHQDYFAEDRYTIADMSLYAYTHVAHEGGFDLEGYPAIRAWLRRVEGQDGYIRMEEQRTGK